MSNRKTFGLMDSPATWNVVLIHGAILSAVRLTRKHLVSNFALSLIILLAAINPSVAERFVEVSVDLEVIHYSSKTDGPERRRSYSATCVIGEKKWSIDTKFILNATNVSGWTIPTKFAMTEYGRNRAGDWTRTVAVSGTVISARPVAAVRNEPFRGEIYRVTDYRFRHGLKMVNAINYSRTNANIAPFDDPDLQAEFDKEVKRAPAHPAHNRDR